MDQENNTTRSPFGNLKDTYSNLTEYEDGELAELLTQAGNAQDGGTVGMIIAEQMRRRYQCDTVAELFQEPQQ